MGLPLSLINLLSLLLRVTSTSDKGRADFPRTGPWVFGSRGRFYCLEKVVLRIRSIECLPKISVTGGGGEATTAAAAANRVPTGTSTNWDYDPLSSTAKLVSDELLFYDMTLTDNKSLLLRLQRIGSMAAVPMDSRGKIWICTGCRSDRCAFGSATSIPSRVSGSKLLSPHN